MGRITNMATKKKSLPLPEGWNDPASAPKPRRSMQEPYAVKIDGPVVQMSDELKEKMREVCSWSNGEDLMDMLGVTE